MDPFRRFGRQAALLIPVFRQIMADVLGETLSFTDSTEASALGAVLLGWQGLGQLPNLQAAQRC